MYISNAIQSEEIVEGMEGITFSAEQIACQYAYACESAKASANESVWLSPKKHNKFLEGGGYKKELINKIINKAYKSLSEFEEN